MAKICGRRQNSICRTIDGFLVRHDAHQSPIHLGGSSAGGLMLNSVCARGRDSRHIGQCTPALRTARRAVWTKTREALKLRLVGTIETREVSPSIVAGRRRSRHAGGLRIRNHDSCRCEPEVSRRSSPEKKKSKHKKTKHLEVGTWGPVGPPRPAGYLDCGWPALRTIARRSAGCSRAALRRTS